ncbi:MAG: heme ABC transporter ATP-binding protein [Actinomycetota bacterium]
MRARVLVEAVSLSVELGGRMLLRDISLRLHAGEVLVLVGPNGAGKSTLLGALVGDVTPAAGTVLWDGAPVERISPRRRARMRAVLLQSNEVSFPFTVAEVVEMGRTPWRGHEREDDDERVVEAALADTEVAHLAQRKTSQLSGGEKARAALARALAQVTPVLVLDEPTAALDIRHQERVLRRARAHAAAGGAVLIVLHDLNLASAYADRIAVLHDGALRMCDVRERAMNAALLSEVYGHPVRVITPFPGEAPLVIPERLTEPLSLAPEVAAGIHPHPNPTLEGHLR